MWPTYEIRCCGLCSENTPRRSHEILLNFIFMISKCSITEVIKRCQKGGSLTFLSEKWAGSYPWRHFLSTCHYPSFCWDGCALMNSALTVKVQYSHPEATNILPNRQVEWTAADTTSTDHFWSNRTKAAEKLLHLFRSISACLSTTRSRAFSLTAPLLWNHYHQISAPLSLLLSSNPDLI